LSSAILYFAIVAIWAGVLMPRWLRPRRRAEAEQSEPTAADAVASFAQPGLEAGDTGERRGEAARRPRRAPDRRPERDAEPVPRAEEDAAARRRNILRARRRMLGTLIVLTVGAIAIAVMHMAAWWVIVPPGVLLGGFLLLLRESARSDRERARREADHARRPPAAEPQAAEPEAFERIASTPEAPEADVLEITATAEIIDISARVSEQVYDQYTDAAQRAVGD